MESLFPKFLNLVILVSILVYYTRAPFKAFIFERHQSMKDELEKTQAQLSEAQKKFQEFSARLQAMDAEIAQLVQQSRQDAEASKVRILTEAKKMSDSIIIDAKKASEGMLAEFKDQIRSEFANQVLVRAETLLRGKLTGDDRLRIVKDFSKQVEAVR